ncbi:MAG: hypothetical protein MJ067_05810, partial [Oscillospiraceae bacterium]|nr:hypothetical protein [Oscillospiraceae bacterium]
MITLKKLSLKIIIFTFVIGMLAILLLCVSKSRIALQENYENDNRVVAGLISNVLDNTFLRPITVAETIARDFTTKEILSIDTQKEAQKIAPLAAEHLKSLRDGFGYSMVYAVSDKSKTFFSVNGISKYIDVENDPAD